MGRAWWLWPALALWALGGGGETEEAEEPPPLVAGPGLLPGPPLEASTESGYFYPSGEPSGRLCCFPTWGVECGPATAPLSVCGRASVERLGLGLRLGSAEEQPQGLYPDRLRLHLRCLRPAFPAGVQTDTWEWRLVNHHRDGLAAFVPWTKLAPRGPVAGQPIRLERLPRAQALGRWECQYRWDAERPREQVPYLILVVNAVSALHVPVRRECSAAKAAGAGRKERYCWGRAAGDSEWVELRAAEGGYVWHAEAQSFFAPPPCRAESEALAGRALQPLPPDRSPSRLCGPEPHPDRPALGDRPCDRHRLCGLCRTSLLRDDQGQPRTLQRTVWDREQKNNYRLFYELGEVTCDCGACLRPPVPGAPSIDEWIRRAAKRGPALLGPLWWGAESAKQPRCSLSGDRPGDSRPSCPNEFHRGRGLEGRRGTKPQPCGNVSLAWLREELLDTTLSCNIIVLGGSEAGRPLEEEPGMEEGPAGAPDDDYAFQQALFVSASDHRVTECVPKDYANHAPLDQASEGPPFCWLRHVQDSELEKSSKTQHARVASRWLQLVRRRPLERRWLNPPDANFRVRENFSRLGEWGWERRRALGGLAEAGRLLAGLAQTAGRVQEEERTGRVCLGLSWAFVALAGLSALGLCLLSRRAGREELVAVEGALDEDASHLSVSDDDSEGVPSHSSDDDGPSGHGSHDPPSTDPSLTPKHSIRNPH